jgi:hypothetical protein
MNGRGAHTGRNPFRVVDVRCSRPRVARSSQPWAEGCNPFGIVTQHRCDRPDVKALE